MDAQTAAVVIALVTGICSVVVATIKMLSKGE